MNVRGGSTAAGAVMEVDDCNAASASQQFNVQATSYTGTGGSGGSGGSGGTGPCASLCSSPTMLAAQSDSVANLGTGAGCFQSSFPINGYSCGNMSGRTFSVNGQPVTCGGNATLPAMLNGGYCFQATAGGSAVRLLRHLVACSRTTRFPITAIVGADRRSAAACGELGEAPAHHLGDEPVAARPQKVEGGLHDVPHPPLDVLLQSMSASTSALARMELPLRRDRKHCL